MDLCLFNCAFARLHTIGVSFCAVIDVLYINVLIIINNLYYFWIGNWVTSELSEWHHYGVDPLITCMLVGMIRACWLTPSAKHTKSMQNHTLSLHKLLWTAHPVSSETWRIRFLVVICNLHLFSYVCYAQCRKMRKWHGNPMFQFHKGDTKWGRIICLLGIGKGSESWTYTRKTYKISLIYVYIDSTWPFSSIQVVNLFVFCSLCRQSEIPWSNFETYVQLARDFCLYTMVGVWSLYPQSKQK